MNQFLLDQFLSGEIVVEIETNEQANFLYDLVSESIPGSCIDIDPWEKNDCIKYPFLLVVRDLYESYLDGRCLYAGDKEIIQYDRLESDEGNEFNGSSQNINLEEVL